MKYDIIVVGGGHAGCEAAHICSFMNKKTLLITSNVKNIADMPCNPSIGGTAKGVIVREIDALGGLMGKVADKSHFQIKMLNDAKGPAVRSLRCQADKVTYPKNMLNMLKKDENLEIIEEMIEDLIVEGNAIKGVITSKNEKIYSEAVILTTGTYLKSSILIGDTSKPNGPHGEKRSEFLSDKLKNLGFKILRLKTGTPPRIKASSINFKVLKEELGSDKLYKFSHDDEATYKINEQEKCYLLYTTDETKQIIKDNLNKSSMYGGHVTGVGPRYCPSIEDKIVRFSDKEKHQLFLEPESKFYDEWYLQGFSTSMPTEIQEKMVHSLPGLENAEITKYAYAIEYDAVDPTQLLPNLETKIISNLFTAGQINGTSGYEEAAGQGLVAGINAVLKLNNKQPLILKRNESYIGVLIDDLVTKGTIEPYRMLTSRAEFRLLLRHDNADIRLREIAHHVGSISNDQYQNTISKIIKINEIIAFLKNNKLKKEEIFENILSNNNINITTWGMPLYDYIKRPDFSFELINEVYKLTDSIEIIEEINIMIKYEGYILKSIKEAEKLEKIENKMIPADIDYKKISNLASEARQKLEQVRPVSIGQASRISGVNPVDISVLAVYLKKEYPNEN